MKQLPEQAKDGTLAEVTQIPVVLWRVIINSMELARDRRETGSGNYFLPEDDVEEYDEDEYDDDYDNENPEGMTDSPNHKAVHQSEIDHPHRHHHGEEEGEGDDEEPLVNFH